MKKVLVGYFDVPPDDIGDVDCPAGQEVVQGNTFECAVFMRDEVRSATTG